MSARTFERIALVYVLGLSLFAAIQVGLMVYQYVQLERERKL